VLTGNTIQHTAGDLRLLNAFATELRGELTFATEGSVQLEFPNSDGTDETSA